jgi:hypothetical protein
MPPESPSWTASCPLQRTGWWRDAITAGQGCDGIMLQTIARGSISFGLVKIPVRLHSAIEPHSVPLNQVHAKDGSRVRLRRICEAGGTEIPYQEVARGYELSRSELLQC